MKKSKKILSVLLAVLMFISIVPVGTTTSHAVTFNELNASNVFLKQEGSRTCTLCSTAMMMRRYSMLRGDTGWSSITESAIKPTAWINGTGLKWSFSYSNSSVSSISVGHYTLPGGSGNEALIQAELKKCPEGIVIYNESAPHAVLLTDYSNGTYYCADPAGGVAKGRIPLSSAYKVTITNVTAYWKVTSPIVNGPTDHNAHSYTSKVTTSPTCYSTGVKTYTCSCGSSYTESISKTSHDYTGTKYKEPDHPHEVLQTCVNYSKCGAYYYNGEYAISNSCSQCWKVEWSLSQSSVSVRVGESKSIDCVITSVLPDTQTSRAEWDEDLFDVAITKNLITVTGKKAGSGSIRMYFWSDSSKSTLISSKTIPVTVTSNKITINYNANGGTGAPSSQTKSYGQSIDLSTTVPTRFGYNFLGWVTDKSHTSADYEPGTSFSLNNDTTLYALWQSADMFLSSSNKTANIKYAGTMCYFQYTAMATSDFVIYSTGSSDTKVYLYDANGNLLASDDDSGESNNFRLKYNLTYGNKYYYGIKFYNSSLKGNINVTFGRVYNIAYNGNATDATGVPSSQEKVRDISLTLSSTEPTRTGYSFRGWSTDPSATTPTYKPGSTYNTNSGATLYAVWKKVFYGNIYNDDVINQGDILFAAQVVDGLKTASPYAIFLGDVNADGQLTSADVDLISQYNLKTIHSFPAESLHTKMNVYSSPYKTTYKKGDTIDSTGLKLAVLYYENANSSNYKSYHIINGGYSISPKTATGSGQQKVTVTLGDWSTYFYITVDNHTHSYTSKITTAPTCAKTGVRTYTCACGTSYTETVSIDSTNHAYSTQIKNKQAATCKTQGYTGDTYCTGCSAKLKTGSVIAKTSHSYGSWITTTKATCTSAGARKKVCSVCNNAVTETVNALGHSFGAYASNNDATYKADGTKTAKCSLCNQSKTVTDKGSRLTVKKPYSVKIEKSTSAVRLTWDKCIGADGYRVFQKTSSGWKTLGTVTKLTGTIRNLKSGTTYTFAIQPYTNINGAKVWGEYLAVTVSTLPVAPTTKVSSPSKGAVKVSWNNVNGAQKYQLYYKVNNGSYKLYKTYNSAQNLTFKNLKSGAKYTFAVRAYRTVDGCNYYSSYKPVTVTIK